MPLAPNNIKLLAAETLMTLLIMAHICTPFMECGQAVITTDYYMTFQRLRSAKEQLLGFVSKRLKIVEKQIMNAGVEKGPLRGSKRGKPVIQPSPKPVSSKPAARRRSRVDGVG